MKPKNTLFIRACSRLRSAQDLLGACWSRCTSRVRQFLLGGGVALLGIVAYLLLWQPAYEGRRKLEKELPILREQALEMNALAREARALIPQANAPAVSGAALQQAILSSLEAHGLKVAKWSLSGDSVLLQLERAPFGAVADWLAEMQRTQRLKVSEARIRYLGSPAQVSVLATLQTPAALEH